MATAGELQILITAQDDASAQLRRIGADVARLSQQVDAAGAGMGTRLAAGISGAADAFRLVGGAAQAVGGIIGAVANQIREGFGSNVELERATIAFQRFTGSAAAAQDIIAALRREAAVSPFNDQEVIAAGQALVASAHGSTDALLELVRVAEQLATLDPVQGITGAVVALQEALSGDFESLRKRFEIPATMIQRLRDQGVPALEIVKQALEFRGLDTGAIEAFGRSFEGRLSTIRSFGQELRQLVTAGPFRALTEVFGHLVELINRFGDQLRTVASAVGEMFTVLAQRAVQGLAPLLGFLDAIAPGLRELVTTEFGRPMEQLGENARKATPEVERLAEALSLPQARQALRDAGGDLERLQALASRTAAPVAVINRELGDIGVKAAEIQLGADRIRQGYEAQIRPLERQLDLLKNSAEAQRLQNALAGNRAAVERLQLEREITALSRAAGGATDPAAPDLTPRQRAIALALEERRLRLEQLDLTRQQAPAVQTIEQRLADLKRQQQDALDPSERLLQTYHDRVAVLQIESQRWQNLKGDIDAAAKAAETAQATIARGGADEPAQGEREETARQRGEAVAKAWLKGFDDWVKAGGGTVWGAISKSLLDWYEANGKPLATRLGTDLGTAMGTAIGQNLGPALQAEVAKNPLLQWLQDQLGGRQGAGGGAAGGSDLAPTVRGRSGLPPALPRVSPEGTGIGPNTLTGGGPNVTVNVARVEVTEGERQARIDELTDTLGRDVATAVVDSLIAAAAGTDPGPGLLVQGAGR